MAKNKDYDARILVNNYLIKYLNNIRSKKNGIYRKLPLKIREDILEKAYTELVDLLDDYLKKYEYTDYTFSPLVFEHIDKIKDKQKLQILRWNISDIIVYAETHYDYKKDDNKNLLFNGVITCFRSIMLHIDILNQDNLTVQLEVLQKKIDNLNSQKIDNEELFKNLQENIKLSSEKVVSIGASVRDILPQAIAIIGIFVAVIVVFIGDVAIVDSFKILGEESIRNYCIPVIIITAHLVIDILFALLFLVSRISKSSINVRCSKFRDISPYYRNQVHHYDIDNKKEVDSNNVLANQLMDLNQELRSITNDRRICANCAYADVECSNSRGDFGYNENVTLKERQEISQKFSSLTALEKQKYFKQKDISEQCGHIDKFIRKYPYIFFTNVIFFLIEIIIFIGWLIAKIFYKGYSFEVINPLVSSLTVISLFILSISLISIVFYSFGKSRKTFLRKKLKGIIMFLITLIILIIMVALNFGFQFIN